MSDSQVYAPRPHEKAGQSARIFRRALDTVFRPWPTLCRAYRFMAGIASCRACPGRRLRYRASPVRRPFPLHPLAPWCPTGAACRDSIWGSSRLPSLGVPNRRVLLRVRMGHESFSAPKTGTRRSVALASTSGFTCLRRRLVSFELERPELVKAKLPDPAVSQRLDRLRQLGRKRLSRHVCEEALAVSLDGLGRVSWLDGRGR